MYPVQHLRLDRTHILIMGLLDAPGLRSESHGSSTTLKAFLFRLAESPLSQRAPDILLQFLQSAWILLHLSVQLSEPFRNRSTQLYLRCHLAATGTVCLMISCASEQSGCTVYRATGEESHRDQALAHYGPVLQWDAKMAGHR